MSNITPTFFCILQCNITPMLADTVNPKCPLLPKWKKLIFFIYFIDLFAISKCNITPIFFTTCDAILLQKFSANYDSILTPNISNSFLCFITPILPKVIYLYDKICNWMKILRLVFVTICNITPYIITLIFPV